MQIVKVPSWRLWLYQDRERYYGWRWYLHVGPFILLAGN